MTIPLLNLVFECETALRNVAIRRSRHRVIAAVDFQAMEQAVCCDVVKKV